MLQLCIWQNFHLPRDICNNVCSDLRGQTMHRRRDSVAATVRDFVEYHWLNFLLSILLNIRETYDPFLRHSYTKSQRCCNACLY